jgi:hypothetical protein
MNWMPTGNSRWVFQWFRCPIRLGQQAKNPLRESSLFVSESIILKMWELFSNPSNCDNNFINFFCFGFHCDRDRYGWSLQEKRLHMQVWGREVWHGSNHKKSCQIGSPGILCLFPDWLLKHINRNLSKEWNWNNYYNIQAKIMDVRPITGHRRFSQIARERTRITCWHSFLNL